MRKNEVTETVRVFRTVKSDEKGNLCKNVIMLCISALFALFTFTGCDNNSSPKENEDDQKNEETTSDWSKYFVGDILFYDEAPDTEGSRIYHSIIPSPKDYIAEQARTVLSTLFFSPEDSIVPVNYLRYYLKDIEGVSAKSGGNGDVTIFYSTRHIENTFAGRDTTQLFFETRGVLLHELTHAYQLEPQGIGSYGTNRVFWAFIEGMADAVRVANGGFTEKDRPIGGNYMDGYRTAGYFFVWLKDNKDPDFLRKFNKSTLEVIPWSFDGGVKYALGKNADIDSLWREYQIAMGDIKE